MYYRNDKRKKSKTVLTILGVIIGVGILLFSLASGYISGKVPKQQGNQQQMQAGTQQSQVQAQASPMAVSPQLAQAVQPQQAAANVTMGTPVAQTVASSATAGVVGITVERANTGSLFKKEADTVGVGSGVIVSPDGYILTNNHVAGGKSKRITVSLADGRNIDGTTVWANPVIDLAVVKVNLTGLPALKLGDAHSLQVGEPAIAIGNPLGLEFQRTVTSGIISALNRTIQIETEQGTNYMEDLIQTDASINPGNSGGPLLNSKGEVVGINTIKVTSAEAIGFAIPVNIAVPIVNKLVNTGTFTEAYMGLFAYDKSVIPRIDGNLKVDNGVYVAHIDENGPAYKAGLRIGCIISKIDGVDINTMLQLRTIIYSKVPGDIVEVTHLNHDTGKWITVPVRLSANEKDGLITR